jgi:hypothetical protein
MPYGIEVQETGFAIAGTNAVITTSSAIRAMQAAQDGACAFFTANLEDLRNQVVAGIEAIVVALQDLIGDAAGGDLVGMSKQAAQCASQAVSMGSADDLSVAAGSCYGAIKKGIEVAGNLFTEDGGFDFAAGVQMLLGAVAQVALGPFIALVGNALTAMVDTIVCKIASLVERAFECDPPAFCEDSVQAAIAAENWTPPGTRRVALTTSSGTTTSTGAGVTVTATGNAPPPPMTTRRTTPWSTYLLWGGLGLGLALVASKTLTGAWVPPKVNKALPKRLRR